MPMSFTCPHCGQRVLATRPGKPSKHTRRIEQLVAMTSFEQVSVHRRSGPEVEEFIKRLREEPPLEYHYRPTSGPEPGPVEITVRFRTPDERARKPEILDWLRQRGIEYQEDRLCEEVAVAV